LVAFGAQLRLVGVQGEVDAFAGWIRGPDFEGKRLAGGCRQGFDQVGAERFECWRGVDGGLGLEGKPFAAGGDGDGVGDEAGLAQVSWWQGRARREEGEEGEEDGGFLHVVLVMFMLVGFATEARRFFFNNRLLLSLALAKLTQAVHRHQEEVQRLGIVEGLVFQTDFPDVAVVVLPVGVVIFFQLHGDGCGAQLFE